MAARTYVQEYARLIKRLAEYHVKHGGKLTAANIDPNLFAVGVAARNAVDNANNVINVYQP